MKIEHKLECCCGWSGDQSKCKIITDFGSGGWWLKRWYCPKCEEQIQYLNQNASTSHPLFWA